MNCISKNRIKKEIEMLSRSPPAGISCSPTNDRLDLLSAQILGEEKTPYEGGVFQLEIQVPERYPFDPPRIRFVTPIYHPNIDTNGRICMDTLKLPPKGSWRPCLNISTVLMMIRVLMAEPGSEDPLMTNIWQEFKYNYTVYVERARQWTKLHATDLCVKKEAFLATRTDVEKLDPVSQSSEGAPRYHTCDEGSNDLGFHANEDLDTSSADPQPPSQSHNGRVKMKKGLGLSMKTSAKRPALEKVNLNV